MAQNKSYGNQTWRKLKKNKLAFSGLVVIVISFFVAVFGYVFAPDHSPNADLQTVEIQARKPGFSQLFLKIPGESNKPSFLVRIFTGTPDDHTYIPITAYSIAGNTLTVQKFVDEDTTVAQQYNIARFGSGDKVVQHITTKKFLLGTDAFGRDILSRLIIGTRVSLTVGLVAVIISLTLGIFLGAVAGYFRGRTDAVIMWFVNITWSIPTLLLVFAITMALGKGFWQILIAVGLTMWVSVARLVRGQVMTIKSLEYVQAAKVLGYTDARIIARHILPNISGPLMVIAAGNFATAIIIEAGLSFLGIGVQPPVPSWGLMIRENYNFIITQNPFLAIVPGIAIMLLVLAFNLLGNGLRDAFDVRSS
jgi:ABC-type dipeptide/oligopeptide/nickel transport system permease subunit